jgi:secondary thiamine-phosphate synthase enzyme
MAYHTTLKFSTKVDEIVRIDHLMHEILNDSKTSTTSGCITAFVPGSTGALTTIEYEPGLITDFPKVLEKLVPNNSDYQHNKLNYDDNGHSHIKAGIIGPSITVPFVNKKMLLGVWQQIVFLEFDTHPRNRKVEIMITS